MNATTTHAVAIRAAFTLEIRSEHKSERTAREACAKLQYKGHPAAVYSRQEAEEVVAELISEREALDAIR